MMEAIKDLSKEEFLELVNFIYTLGYCDCENHVVRGITTAERTADLQVRVETWLELDDE